MFARPDGEPGQALLRAVIISLLLGETAWAAHRRPDHAAWLWGINLCSIAFSLGMLAWVRLRPGAAQWRRALGVVHDNVAITAWLVLSGPGGALALFVYPFVTIGNGFRFGVRYLAGSGLLGAACIAFLVLTTPGWDGVGRIGVGVLLSHVVVTAYTGALLRRLHATRAELERLATRDGLTGLANRRCFMERLSTLAAPRDDQPLVCLYLDLDGFKAVNDRWGHRVGDELLTRVGRAVLGCLRPTDLLARLGGDEFSVLLGETTTRGEAEATADRIIRAVESIRDVDGHAVVVSASVGVAYVAADERARWHDADELLRAADEAMYAAKRSGRGHHRFVEIHTDRAA